MNQTSYSPGLHKLVTLQVDNISKLTNSKEFLIFSDMLFDKFSLEKVGVITHDFDNKSFTVAICLKESHICIHTWPEYQQLTLDVYLCNYLQDNSEKVKAIVNDYVNFFGATVIKEFEINR